MRTFKEHKELLESASVGADYEPAIVIGYYKASGRKVPTPDKMEIRPQDVKKILNSPVLTKAGVQIAKKLISSKVPKGKEGRQLGSSSESITPFWKKYGGSNTTPKTDLVLGTHRISLKIGPAQLMSGSAGESKATFQAALQDPKVKTISRTKEGKTVMEGFEKFVLKGFTPTGSVQDVLKGKVKDAKGKVVKDALLERGNKHHKKFMKDVEALFERSEDFKIAFVREAMTGEYKFGKKSDAYAQWFLVGNKTGTNISYHSANNKAYLKKIADIAKVDVRFKSNSQSVKGVKTGAYRYYSVLGLGVTKLDVMKEEYMAEHRMLFESELTEGMLKDIWNKFKNWFMGYISKVKAWVEQSVQNLIEFFQVDPIINVNNTIDFAV